MPKMSLNCHTKESNLKMIRCKRALWRNLSMMFVAMQYLCQNFAPLQAAASDDIHSDNFPNKPDTPFSWHFHITVNFHQYTNKVASIFYVCAVLAFVCHTRNKWESKWLYEYPSLTVWYLIASNFSLGKWINSGFTSVNTVVTSWIGSKMGNFWQ